MRIGLIRHFKITLRTDRKWMTSAEFIHWIRQYDESGIQVMEHNVRASDWELCLSSDMTRAALTASQVYGGPVITTSLLREIGMRPVINTGIRLHYGVWLVLSRAAWLLSHRSQEECRAETEQRAVLAADRIEACGVSAVLVVSHGAFIRSLSKELLRRGYRGKSSLKPVNGRLYVFDKQDEKP
jgi:broad specificity phosphatase PhoE